MMKYVEAPNRVDSRKQGEIRVFLGGGITNCPDWQAELKAELKDDELTLVNPRRARFPMDRSDAAREQIVWEHARLEDADVILFWFPKETLCPITLYELGAWSRSSKSLVVGCHPGYERKFDVEVQTELARPEIYVVDSLEAMVVQLRSTVRAKVAARAGKDDSRY